MAKEPRTKMSGKEARYILKQANVNLSWLAEQIGITPQSMQSRLNAATFSVPYQLEINNICGKRIFDVDMASTITETKGRIPVIDMRVSAGFGVSLLDGNEQRIGVRYYGWPERVHRYLCLWRFNVSRVSCWRYSLCPSDLRQERNRLRQGICRLHHQRQSDKMHLSQQARCNPAPSYLPE